MAQQLPTIAKHHARGDPTMTTNIKLKLIGLFATVAVFTLPIAQASATHSW
jgi:hypothetical protein